MISIIAICILTIFNILLVCEFYHVKRDNKDEISSLNRRISALTDLYIERFDSTLIKMKQYIDHAVKK